MTDWERDVANACDIGPCWLPRGHKDRCVPSGMGEPKMLDPEAWKRPWNDQRTSFPAHPTTGYRFSPRAGYSQNIEDYAEQSNTRW